MTLLLNKPLTRVICDENGVMEIEYADYVNGPELHASKLTIHASEVRQFCEDLMEAANKATEG
jgi:hypothetical protein